MSDPIKTKALVDGNIQTTITTTEVVTQSINDLERRLTAVCKSIELLTAEKVDLEASIALGA
jgi:hypothetical protein